MLLSPVKSRHERNWLHFNTPSGGEKRRELSALLWRAMIFPVKPSYLSVHPAEVISAPAQPAWNSLQTELLGLMDGG